MTWKGFSVLCLLTAAVVTAQGQTGAEFEEFMRNAGNASTLFRGAGASVYPISYNGNYYWGSPDFETGSVTFNGRWYGPLAVNINADRQELLIKQGRDNVEISIPCDLVDNITKGHRSFLNLYNAGFDVPKGFYEVLYDGDARLFKRVDKVLKSDANAQNGISIGYNDPNFNPANPRYFQYSVRYYLFKDGSLYILSGKNDVWKYFTSEQKRAVKSQLRRHNLNSLDRERFYIEVLSRIEDGK